MSSKSKIGKGVVALAMAGVSMLGVTGTASASADAPYLGYGYTTSGDGVWCVQHSLNYYLQHNGSSYRSSAPYWSIDEDGKWGPQTDATVRWFQAHFDLDQDAVVGSMTGTKLLVYGDPYYNGNIFNGPGYCYWKIPGTLHFVN